MERVLTLAMLVAVMLVRAACAQAGDRLLGGFEDTKDLDLWRSSTAQVSISDDYAAVGSHSLKVVLPAGASWPGIAAAEAALGDWLGYDLFTLRIYNAGESTVGLNVRIDDDESTGAYQSQFNTSVRITPGWNRFRFVLAQLRTISGRPIHRDHIKGLTLFTGKLPEEVTLYLDDVKLTQLAGKLEVPGVRAFDFGVPTSPVWPGFTKVTAQAAYGQQQGFGWVTGSVGHKDSERPDDLARDHVFSGGDELAFAVDVPAGDYVVWLLTGDLSSYGWTQDRTVSISIQGKEVTRLERTGASLSKMNYRDRDFPSTQHKSAYDTFIAPRFTEVWGEASVADGQLRVSLRPGQAASLCALVLAPKDQEQSLRNALGELSQGRKEQYEEDWWREVKHLDVTPAPTPTSEDRKRGFLLFSAGTQQLIHANTQLRPEQLNKPLTGSAARGQYESMVLAVRPLEDLFRLSVRLSQLAGPGGSSITPRDIEVRMVQYHACITSGFHHSKGGTFECKPWFLTPRRSIDAQAGVNRAFWITVHVPEDAPGGSYQGEAQVLVNESVLATVPVEFEVHPFSLAYPPDLAYAHWVSWPGYKELLEPLLRNLYEHGQRSFTPAGVVRMLDRRDAQGHVQLDLSRLDELMGLARAIGLRGPVPLVDLSIQGAVSGNSYSHLGLERRFGYKLDSPGYLEDMAEMCRQIKRHAAEEDWLPVLYYSATELSQDESLGPPYHEKLLRAMKSAGDIPTISSINRPEDLQTLPWLDHVMLNNAVPINEETLAKVKESGSVLWYQNVGGNRFIEGLYMWRTQAKGHRQFWVLGHQGDPFNEFDGTERDTAAFLLPSADGWIGTINWEWMREGVDDYRYLYTLTGLVERGREAGGETAKLAAEAQGAIDEMMAQVPVDFGDAVRTYVDGWSENSGPLTPKAYDEFRRTLARFITELSAALSDTGSQQ